VFASAFHSVAQTLWELIDAQAAVKAAQEAAAAAGNHQVAAEGDLCGQSL